MSKVSQMRKYVNYPPETWEKKKEKKKKSYIHNLLDVMNNHRKIQLNQIRT